MMGRSLPLLLVCTAVLGCGAANGDSALDERAIEATQQAVSARMDEYIANSREDRVNELGDYWTAEAQLMEPQVHVRGREAIVAMLTDLLKKSRVSAISLSRENIFVHDRGAAAYQFGSFVETIVSKDGSAPTRTVRSNFVARWVKESDGKWRMDRFIETPRPNPR